MFPLLDSILGNLISPTTIILQVNPSVKISSPHHYVELHVYLSKNSQLDIFKWMPPGKFPQHYNYLGTNDPIHLDIIFSFTPYIQQFAIYHMYLLTKILFCILIHFSIPTAYYLLMELNQNFSAFKPQNYYHPVTPLNQKMW